MNFQLRRLRPVIKDAYINLLRVTGLLRWARRRVARRGIVVLTLHRVLRDGDYDSMTAEPGMAVRESTFEALLQYLKTRCESQKAETCTPGPAPNARPRVALTFDDGWKDNLEVAWPLGQKHQADFTIFVCPELVSGSQTFWTEEVAALWQEARRTCQEGVVQQVWQRCFNHSIPASSPQGIISKLKQASADARRQFIHELTHALGLEQKNGNSQTPLLTWAEIKRLANFGVSFGSHTATHQILTRIPEATALIELSSSRAALAEKLNECSLLAYPNGDWSESVRMLAARCGYEKAFINHPGVWTNETHPLSIPRVNLWERHLTNSSGHFSEAHLEYSIFWRALLA